MLEGNELEKQFDNGAGIVVLDVDAKGKALVRVSYAKDVVDGVSINSTIELKIDALILVEMIVKKTPTEYDDKLLEIINKATK